MILNYPITRACWHFHYLTVNRPLFSNHLKKIQQLLTSRDK